MAGIGNKSQRLKPVIIFVQLLLEEIRISLIGSVYGKAPDHLFFDRIEFQDHIVPLDDDIKKTGGRIEGDVFPVAGNLQPKDRPAIRCDLKNLAFIADDEEGPSLGVKAHARRLNNILLVPVRLGGETRASRPLAGKSDCRGMLGRRTGLDQKNGD